MTINGLVQEAAVLCGRGKIDEAEVICHRVIAAEPGNVRAMAILGVICCQQGKESEGIALLEKAVALQPDYAAAFANLGKAYLDAGRYDDALSACKRAITLNPGLPLPHSHLGTALRLKGDYEQAVHAFRAALFIDPTLIQTYIDLGVALRQLGRFDEAADAYRSALVQDPRIPEAHYNLGNVLADLHKTEEAEASYCTAIQLKPDYYEPVLNLGNLYYSQDRVHEALAKYRAALAIKANAPEAHYNMGNALIDLHQLEDAAQFLQNAIRINPNCHEPYVNFGKLCLSQALVPEAITHFRKALELKRENVVAHSNLVFCMNYDPAVSDAEVFAEHLKWDLYHGQPLRQQLSQRYREPLDKVLRIGYVSADFKKHPVGHFLIPVIPAHDRSKFTVFCYNQAKTDDEFTPRFRRATDVWRDIYQLDDAAVAKLISADGIDILIDLAGHTGGSRLMVFARKPAPIQMTWAGYIGTTGLSAIDYLISDWQESPLGAEKYCSEKIIRLPNAYVCFEPPVNAPPVGLAPILTNGYVTFGCFNNLVKVTPQVVELWGKLMTLLPESRVILKTKILQSETVKKRFTELFAAAGIDASRVDLQGQSPHRELLDTYNKIDIALDPFPYSGGLTTLEALWMGVPVVTLGGSRFCSRHSITHLTAAGLPELIAASADDYIRIAAGLARDCDRLVTLRSGLRNRVARSPLCDGKGFTRDLEAAFIEAWRRWCLGEGTASFCTGGKVA